MTRNVVLYQLLSLDGVAEEPGDWISDGGPEVFANLAETIATQDDVLLGRGTYDYWVGYWPTVDDRAVRLVHQRRAQARRELERAGRDVVEHHAGDE